MGKGYINIQDWMIECDLDMYETLILAIIYGFSQDGESYFQGSLAYLANRVKCSRTKAQRSLQTLVEKGLIEKRDKVINGVHLCDYRYSPTDLGIVSQQRGHSPTETHNNSKENNNNTLSNNKTDRFKKPSVDEVRDYCLERGNLVDAETFVSFYESNGWMVGRSHMKDWKAAVRTWEKRQTRPAPQRQASSPAPQRESVFAHNKRVYESMFGNGKQVDEQ